MADHRTALGRVYTEDCRAISSRYPVGSVGRHWVKEHGRVAVDLDRVGSEIERLYQKPNPRLRDLRRLKREQRILRAQLLAVERRLEELARVGTRPPLSKPLTMEELLGSGIDG